jgi:site-specific DNA recombinase
MSRFPIRSGKAKRTAPRAATKSSRLRGSRRIRVLDRRQERAERRREHIAELNKRAAETDLRLKRLYDAIEAGVAELDDPALKERIAGLKAIRDQARADSERAAAMLETSDQQAITPHMVRKLARTARERIRIDGGGYRRDHLRALAQRVEIADREVPIIGSKSNLLQTLTAAAGGKPGVRSSVLKWRRERNWKLTFSSCCIAI